MHDATTVALFVSHLSHFMSYYQAKLDFSILFIYYDIRQDKKVIAGKYP